MVCPACGKETHRIISGGSGFLLRGHGFYATDYRSKQYEKDAAKDKVPSSSSSTDGSSPKSSSPSATGSSSSKV